MVVVVIQFVANVFYKIILFFKIRIDILLLNEELVIYFN